ncbi:Putative sodium-dependent multivitamin transporter [Eumeta japonica]|uniref:Sodium-dependent multivitamin transporter n=1 Tax=Eumeta variegata TaxID=151549 RepID=A0A4C1VHN7_EUMVA|nr:Putative sodium-dependent multivitamin transporter [Eumeta japonica]
MKIPEPAADQEELLVGTPTSSSTVTAVSGSDGEVGASLGLLSGIAFTLWISFGRPRPPLQKLPVSVEGCAFNVTLPPPVEINPNDYLYPYRISYLWTCPIGFLWVMVVGSLVSLYTRRVRKPLDPSLFVPPLAARLRRLQKEKEKTNVQVWQ